MKFVAITLLAFVAAAIANPISVSNNNIGDIVTVGLNANAVLTSNIEQNIVTLLAALLNQQAIGVSAGNTEHVIDHEPVAEQNEVPQLPEFNISPELIETVKNNISPELIQQFKALLNKEE